jgi:hypothetical protein
MCEMTRAKPPASANPTRGRLPALSLPLSADARNSSRAERSKPSRAPLGSVAMPACYYDAPMPPHDITKRPFDPHLYLL